MHFWSPLNDWKAIELFREIGLFDPGRFRQCWSDLVITEDRQHDDKRKSCNEYADEFVSKR
ncbi:MAG: hypothetical protein GY930_15495 [bacterium]|nr:hypothetical protein [bacterium]